MEMLIGCSHLSVRGWQEVDFAQWTKAKLVSEIIDNFSYTDGLMANSFKV